MLIELNVSQFAIIENLKIQFHNGLNILSGETGAGKSVLLKSLALLMGGKSSSDMIRTGAPQAIVEGQFDLSHREDIQERLRELDIPFDEKILVVRRVIGANDKNKIYLNGTLSTAASLKEIVAPMIEVTGRNIPLIEMTGQHENKNLLNKNYQLDLLDHSAGIWKQRKEFEKKYSDWKMTLSALEKKKAEHINSEQKLDYLVFQKNEIAGLDLSPGEEDELEFKIKKLKSVRKLNQFIDSAEDSLINSEDSALARISKVISKSSEILISEDGFTSNIDGIANAKILIEESIYSMRKYIDKISDELPELEALETKLNLFRKLQKKYGPTVSDILQSLIQIETEIYKIQNHDTDVLNLTKKEKELALQLKKMAEDLHEIRSKNAVKLEKAVNKELIDLNMKGCKFNVAITKNVGNNSHDIKDGFATQLNSTGLSLVEFMSQTSPSDPPRPLAKFASGGELSRILLSLKCVTGTSTIPRTYLFDEVDTGVSGTTAQKVGSKLRQIAQGQQVVCVTHLPQVAAYADHHYLIQKNPTAKNAALMNVKELKSKEKIEELARLISGEKITSTSLAHAKELLNQSQA